MKLKKIIASLLSISMIVASSTSIFAYDVDSNDAKEVLIDGTTLETIPTLKLVTIESDGATSPMPKITDGKYVEVDPTTLPDGSSFFVGIRADNFTQFKHNVDKIFMWGTGVAYDPTYVTWEPSTSRGQSKAFTNRIDNEDRWDFTYDTFMATYQSKNTEDNANVPENCTKTAVALVQYNITDYSYMFPMEASEYIAFLEFKITGTANAGTKVFALSGSDTDTCLSFGTPDNSYAYTYNSDLTKLQDYLKLDNSGVDVFPASSSDYLNSLTVKTKATKDLDSYIEGQKFDPTGLELTPSKNESGALSDITGFTTTNFSPVTDGTVKFYVDAANAAADTLDKSREITTTTELAATDSSKHIYAAYTLDGKTAIADLGAITVAAKSVSSITVKSGSTLGKGTSYYSSDKIYDLLTRTTPAAETLEVTIAYDNGTSDDVAYSAFASKNVGLYILGSENKLVKVDANTKLAVGNNTLYVVDISGNTESADNVAGKTLAELDTASIKYSGAISINGVLANNLQIDSRTDNAALKKALKYSVDIDGTKTFNFDNVEITTHYVSDATATTTQNISQYGADDLVFFYSDSATGTYSAANVIAKGDAYVENTHKGKYVFVASKADTTSAVCLGQLGNRAIDTSVTATPSNIGAVTSAATYGDKLGEMSLTVTYDNGDTKTLTYTELVDAGVTIKINGASVTKDTVLTPAMSGNKVEFWANDASDTSTKFGESTAITVNKKEVGFKSKAADATTAPEVKKEYDGNKTVEDEDIANIAIEIDSADLLEADAALASKLDITGAVYEYNDKTVNGANKVVLGATSNLAVAVSSTGAATDVTTFNDNYKFKAITDDNKTVASSNVSITQKALTISPAWTITQDAGKVEVGASGTDLIKSGLELNLTTANSNIVDGDAVKLTYTATYAEEDVTSAGTPEVTISNASISGDDWANYSFNASTAIPSGVKGTVENKTLSSISIATHATNMSVTYPTTTLDLAGLTITVQYQGATAGTPISLADFIALGGTVQVVNKAGQTVSVTDENMTGEIELPYGNSTVTFGLEGKTATETITVNRKPIALSDITFAASKVFGNDTVNGTATLPANILEGDDVVTVNATYTFTDTPEVAGENKNVTISAISLAGDDVDNYELVDNGAAITASTTAAITDGVITQGEQTAPEAPTVNLDSKTNNVTVTGPLGDRIEYSKDGVNWQDSTLFDNLALDTQYTIYARVKATDDGNYAASTPSTVQVTTYKYHVRAFKTKADITTAKPISEVYTNTAMVASDSEMNSNVFTSKPSKWKAYYTDAEGKVKIEYPYSIKADTVLYMTQTSGGGGGSSSSVSIKLDKTSVESTVGEVEKITATITGSTSTPKWTSANEDVCTVDENGNITMVGEGKTTVKISVDGTVKTINVTVGKAEATPTPVPTDKPEPTDTPLINTKYTEPYASGYEDNSFRPENNITRAELAAMIARLSNGSDIADGEYGVSSFPDVSPDAWYSTYVAYLENHDVLSGYEDGTFRPENTVTRSEICSVLARAQQYGLIAYDGRFTDVTEDDWAKDFIVTLADKNIVSGYLDGSFAPYAPLTRSEAVAMINRVLEPSQAIVTFDPNDISGHWAEDDILLAVNKREVIGEDTESEEAIPEEVQEEDQKEIQENETQVEEDEDNEGADETEGTEDTSVEDEGEPAFDEILTYGD